MINKVMYLLPVFFLACEGESEPAKRVEVPIGVAALSGPLTTHLGYTVDLTTAELVIDDLTFTRGGEAHTVALSDLLIGTAHAHPGHLAGGDVLGELKGRHRIDLRTPGTIGTATLVEGPFDGAGFLFGVGAEGEGPIAGATLAFAGTATREGRTVSFTAAVVQDPNRQVVGIPFDVEVGGGATITFGLVGEGLFDGVDFFALAGDAPAFVINGEGTHRLRRTTQSHEQYRVDLVSEN